MKRPEDIASEIAKSDEELVYLNVYKRINAIFKLYSSHSKRRDQILKLYSYDIEQAP
jgi:hypothetical protein